MADEMVVRSLIGVVTIHKGLWFTWVAFFLSRQGGGRCRGRSRRLSDAQGGRCNRREESELTPGKEAGSRNPGDQEG